MNHRSSGSNLSRVVGDFLIGAGVLIFAVGGILFLSLATQNQVAPPPITSLGESILTGTSSSPLVVNPFPALAPSVFPSPQPTAGRPTRAAITPLPGVPSRLLGETTLPTLLPTRSVSPSRIAIPQIGVDAPVIEVGWQTVNQAQGVIVEWETAAYAAGHQVDSPGVGQRGNMVITGHNNIYGEVFRNLSEVQVGAEITISAVSGTPFRYVVKEILVVRETDATPEERAAHARYLDPTPDVTLTLISCYPYSSNTHRVIVVAKGMP